MTSTPIPSLEPDPSTREVQFLADQLDRGFYGGAWHGPALHEVLEGVDAADAARRVLPEGKTLWELVLHLAAWNRIAAQRIRGEEPKVTDAVDWPPVEVPSPEAWQAATAQLEAGHRDLYRTVRCLTDARLDDAVPGSDPTVRGLLLGTLQHNSYHAGQIALLKKARR
jgi:hypothetical protein